MRIWRTEEEIHAVHYGMIQDADPGTVSHLGGHLEYRRDHGVRQKQRSSCRTCKWLGWDNGKWHQHIEITR